MIGNNVTTDPRVITNSVHVIDLYLEQSKMFKGEKYWGTYGIFGLPMLVVTDLELIRNILSAYIYLCICIYI